MNPSSTLELKGTFGGMTVRRFTLGAPQHRPWSILGLSLSFAMAIGPAHAAPVVSEAGKIAAEFDVSPKGSADYSIPIRVAPGTQGLQPKLALQYSSLNAGNGPVGLGFRLTGISAITRCPKTYAHDGVRGSTRMDYSPEARLCLDGQRLVLASGASSDGAYWAPTAEYRTEEESWQRVIRTENGGLYNHFFTVESPDGTVRTYGTGNAFIKRPSGVETAWLLKRAVDRHGNEMVFNYTVDSMVTYLSSISYGGRSVEFTYETRPSGPDQERPYNFGLLMVQSQRLQTIESKVDGQTFLRYHLEYELSPESGRSRLSKVFECSASDACLPPIELTWHGEARDAVFNAGLFSTIQGRRISLLEGHVNIVSGDFNGDGRVDFLRQPVNDHNRDPATVFYSEGRSFRAQALSSANYRLRFDKGALLIPGDYNGDGKTDFVRQERGGWDNDSNGTFSVFFANPQGDGFTEAMTSNGDIQHSSRHEAGCFLFPVDVDGDGKTDLLRQERGGWDNDRNRSFEVWFSRGNGEFDIVLPGVNNQSGDEFQDHLRADERDMQIIPGDFNGDGLGDFAARYTGTNSSYSKRFRVFLSRGNGQFIIGIPSSSVRARLWGPKVKLIPGDINGDGRTDFFRQFKASAANNELAYIEVYLSKGKGDFEFIPFRDTLGDHSDFLPLTLVHPGDFNGDGKTDFFVQPSDGPGFASSPAPYTAVYYSNGDGSFQREIPSDNFVNLLPVLAQLRYVSGVEFYPNFVYERISLFLADYDGDGRTDILSRSQVEDTGQLFELNPAVYYSKPQDRLPDHLVRTIRTGSGLERTLSYAPMSRGPQEQNSVYDPRTISSSGYPLRESRGPTYLVRKVIEQALNDNSTRTTQSYRYEGAVSSSEGHGFLGFDQITVDLPEEGLTKEFSYLNDLEHQGRLFHEKVFDRADDRLVLERSLTWTDVSAPGAPTKLMRITRETNRSYEGSGMLESHVDYGYNARGARVFEATYGFDGEGVFTCRTFGHDENRWRIGQLLTEDVTTSGTSTPPYACHGQTLSKLELIYDSNDNVEKNRRFDTHQGVWEETSFEYDSYGNRIRTTDAAQIVQTTTYDSQFHTYPVMQAQDPDGLNLITRLAFDPRFAILLEREDPAGAVAIQRIDALGRLIESAVRDGQTGEETLLEGRSYHQQGSQMIVTLTQYEDNAPSKTTRMVSDHLGRKIREERTGPDGKTILELTEWNAANQLTSRSHPHFVGEAPKWSFFLYDAVGRFTFGGSGGPLLVSNAYEVGGDECAPTELLTRMVEGNFVDPRRFKIECRNFRGDVTRRVFLHGATKTAQNMTYDALGRLTSTWAEDGTGAQVGSRTDYTYDSLGRRVVIDHSQRGRTEFTFVADRLMQRRLPSGQTITHNYDSAGRLTSVVHPDGTEHHRSYDASSSAFSKDRISEVRTILPGGAPGATRTYDYDLRGRTVQETVRLEGHDYTLGYRYRSDDQLAQVTYPDDSSLHLNYDAAGNLLRMQLEQMVGTELNTSTYVEYSQYTPRGQPKGVFFSNGIQTDYNYDDLGRLERVVTTSTKTTQSLMDRTYAWNIFDEIASITDGLEPSDSQTFSYDQRGFLVQATGPYGNLQYGYDAAGNLTQKGGISFTYDKEQVRASSAGDVFDYDSRGNRISKATSSGLVRYTYSSLDQLTEVTREIPQPGCDPSAGDCPASQQIALDRYEYDANGARVKKWDATGVVSLYISPLYEIAIHPDGTHLATKYMVSPAGRIAAVTEEIVLGASSSTPASLVGLLEKMPSQKTLTEALALSLLLFFGWFSLRAAGRRTRLGRARGAVLQLLYRWGWVSAKAQAQGARAYGTAFMRQNRGFAAAMPAAGAALVVALSGCGPESMGISKVQQGRYGLSVSPSGMLHAQVQSSLLPGARGAGYPVAGTHFFHPDHLGSSTLVTDAMGDEIAKTFYLPYGDIYEPASRGVDVYRSKFAGKEWDDSAELYYFNARHYDPYTGRFVQADILPFGSNGALAADLNRYAYAANNPIVYTDPSGRAVSVGAVLLTVLVAALVGGTIGLGVYGATVAVNGDAFTLKGAAIAVGVGAITGVAAVGLGAGLSAGAASLFPTYLAAGSVANAVVTGVVTGFITGFGGSLLENGFYGEKADFKGAAIAGAIDGLSGGIVDGWFSKANVDISLRKQAVLKKERALDAWLENPFDGKGSLIDLDQIELDIDRDLTAAIADHSKAKELGFSVPKIVHLDREPMGLDSGISFFRSQLGLGVRATLLSIGIGLVDEHL